jgi:hypothetical protein
MQREGIGEQVDAGSIVHGKVEDLLMARARALHAYLVGL